MIGGTPGTDYVECPHCSARFRDSDAFLVSQQLFDHVVDEHPEKAWRGDLQ